MGSGVDVLIRITVTVVVYPVGGLVMVDVVGVAKGLVAEGVRATVVTTEVGCVPLAAFPGPEESGDEPHEEGEGATSAQWEQDQSTIPEPDVGTHATGVGTVADADHDERHDREEKDCDRAGTGQDGEE
ncbi:MAG: hypothetical protein P8J32_08665, partial [bacterium]|nr:hypothetical protein [bacterium]